MITEHNNNNHNHNHKLQISKALLEGYEQEHMSAREHLFHENIIKWRMHLKYIIEWKKILLMLKCTLPVKLLNSAGYTYKLKRSYSLRPHNSQGPQNYDFMGMKGLI